MSKETRPSGVRKRFERVEGSKVTSELAASVKGEVASSLVVRLWASWDRGGGAAFAAGREGSRDGTVS